MNATSLGMQAGDPLPVDPDGIESGTYVADVVNKKDMTPLVAAARDRGCIVQDGSDMLIEMVPAYLGFFGFEGAEAEDLRQLLRVPVMTAAPPPIASGGDLMHQRDEWRRAGTPQRLARSDRNRKDAHASGEQ